MEKIYKFTSKTAVIFTAVVCTFIICFILADCPVNAAESGVKVRVGMKYGTTSPSSYKISAASGVSIGIQEISGSGRSFTPIISFSDVKEVQAATDKNLLLSNGSYVASTPDYAIIGGYHVQLTAAFTSIEELNKYYGDVNYSIYQNLGYNAFPAYINGTYRLRIGSFKDQATAENALPLMQNVLPGWGMTVVAPDATTTSIISPAYNRILFECTSSAYVAGVAPVSSSDYLKAEDGYIYEGVFAFPRYVYNSTDGVSVINVLDIDRYTAGVIPYEVFVSWNEETLRAFAVTVRSYAIGNFSSGNSTRYNFDLTNKMQVYNGAKSITDKVNKVVNDTSGIVIAYGGRVATAYYSSSMGGTTAYSGDIWASYVPYTVSVNTPWERYTEFSNGLWFKEITPNDLSAQLKSKGYSMGEIDSVEITSYGSDTPYVTGLKFTDTAGKSITVSGGDNVRTTLGYNIVKSANFVVGKGSVSYSKDTVSYSDPQSNRFNLSSFSIISSLGKFISSNRRSYNVVTGNGSGVLSGNDAYVSTDPNFSYNANKNFYTVTKSNNVYTASSTENFVFVGKGYGHGVGASQYGMRDLGVLGYSYEEILHAYFTDVEVTNINSVSY